jgi:acetate kinase
MSKILAVNAGSSSLKFQLLNMPAEDVICEGIVERIGFEDANFIIKVNGEKHKTTTAIADHKVAVKMLLEALTQYEAVASLDEIEGIGHRIVHGGEEFSDSVVIDDEVIAKVDALSDLAPLHNPANLTGIRAFQEALPNVPAVGVFDTAFHQTMPKEAYMYATPYEWYEKFGVRKYGFHGTSHKYVSGRAMELLGNDQAKVVVAHLGNGASLCAVDAGKSVDTSMGFTPLAGIPMGTRSGDVDPAVIPFMKQKLNASADEVVNALNKKSGFLGLSGVSSDSRDIEDGIEEGHERSILTQDVYAYKIAQYIGSYAVALGGLDAVCFTAGIGENAAGVREAVMSHLKVFGVSFDPEENKVRGKEKELTDADSKVKVYLIPTNEEVVIARDTVRLTK